MAISRILIASILLSLVVLQIVEADQMINSDGESPTPTPTPVIDCGAACAVRCRLSSRPNLCHRACGTCCERCHCVPSGTFGHYEECPCYANMTTHGGVHKCP